MTDPVRESNWAKASQSEARCPKCTETRLIAHRTERGVVVWSCDVCAMEWTVPVTSSPSHD